MKFKELANMTPEDQDKKQYELELELIKLNSQVATGTPPKNSGMLRKTKKEIAKLMLLRSMREKKAELQKELGMKKQKTTTSSGQGLRSSKDSEKIKQKSIGIKQKTDKPNE